MTYTQLRATAIATLFAFVWGCADSPVVPTAPATPRLAVSGNGQGRSDVCHVDDQGRAIRITVADPALDTHISHGDATPHLRPDPLPAGSTFSASNIWDWWQGYLTYEPVASRAFDGDPVTMWNSGTYSSPYSTPNQWIEVDFGSPQQFSGITAIVAQSPVGNTTHEVSLDGVLAFTWSGDTKDRDILSYTFPSLQTAQKIRITTTYSTSWIAWFEITVLGWGC